MGKKKDPNSLYNREMRKFEKGLIEWAISQTGSIQRAAEVLGLDRKYLGDRALACEADVEAAKAAARKAAKAIAAEEQTDG